ncbi:hypothetical protein A7982_13990 [Minicystis rosea]|nr:hypothetical protein A7982_13990 [Minicystis rosea]
MASLDHHPPDHSLFSRDEPLAGEIRRMIAWCRLLLEDDPHATAHDAAWHVPEGAVEPLVSRIRAGLVPPEAFEVLAGFTALVQSKEYRMRFVWAGAWELMDTESKEAADDGDADPASLLTDEELEEIAEIERSSGPEAAADLRQVILDEIADEQRRERERVERLEARIAAEPHLRAVIAGPDGRGRRPRTQKPAAAPPPDTMATADRVAPIAADGARRYSARKVRPILWHNRTCGPAWAALCAAYDVVGAGSHAGLSRLRAIADASPGSPAIAWLDEMAHRISRDDRRAAAAAARLDTALASGVFGMRDVRAIYVVSATREQVMVEHGTAIADAWLRLAAFHRTETTIEDPPLDMTPGERKAITRSAKAGDPRAQLIASIDVMLDHLKTAERRDEELEGPFHTLGVVPSDVEEPLDKALFYLTHGFRRLYALELLRDALPKLEAWAAEQE